MAAQWSFVTLEEDGVLWMRNSEELHALVEFAAKGARTRHRIMVVTKSFVAKRLAQVRHGAAGAGTLVFPPLLIVPDGTPAQLRSSIDAVVSRGGLEHFARTASAPHP